MDDMTGRVAQNSFFLYTGKVVNLMINFVIFVFLANYFGEVAFGRLSFAITFIGFFDIIANFGLNSIVVREIAVGRYQERELLGSGILLRVALSVVAIIFSVVVINIMRYPNETSRVVAIISINLLISTKLSSVRSILETFFLAKLRMASPTLYSIIDSLVLGALILWFAQRGLTLTKVAVIYTACNVPGAILLLWKFTQRTTVELAPRLEVVKYLANQALPLCAFVAFSTLNTKADILLLSLLKGDADVGFYSVSTRLVLPFLFLSTSISMSLFPLLSSRFGYVQEEFLKIVRIGTKLIGLLSVYLAITCIAFSDDIFRILYVSSYAVSISTFRILVLAMSLLFLNFFFVDVLIAARQQKIPSIILLLVLIFNIGTNIILISRFGFIGAAHTRLLSSLLAFILLFGTLRLKLELHGLFNLLRVFGVALTYALLLYGLRNLPTTLSFPVACVLFGGIVLLFRYFSRMDWYLLKSFFKRQM